MSGTVLRLIGLAILLLAAALALPTFLSSANARLLLTGTSGPLLVATGTTIVLVLGLLDLSVGSIMFLSGGVAVVISAGGASIAVACAAGVGVGLGVGVLNGILVAGLGMSPLLTTLGTMIAVRGVGLTVIGGQQILLPPDAQGLQSTQVAGLPAYVIVAFALAIVAEALLRRTQFGRRCVAIGCSPENARKLGLPAGRYTFGAYLISALLASLGGLVAVANLGGVQTYLGKGAEFTAIAAAVVGGTSLFGGVGSVVPGTIAGVLFLAIIENGLNLAGSSPFVFPFVTGLTILIAMYLQTLKPRLG